MTYKKNIYAEKMIKVQCRLHIMIKNYDDDKFLTLMLASFFPPNVNDKKTTVFWLYVCFSLPMTSQEIVV